MSQKISVFLIAAVLFTTACSGGETGEVPDHLTDLENLTVFGANISPERSVELIRDLVFNRDGDVDFGRMAEQGVDREGRVYIAEGRQGHHAVHLFEPGGRYRGAIGRSGEGPGEFSSIFDMTLHGSRLYVLDASQLRIHLFSAVDQTYEGAMELKPSQWDFSDEMTMTFPNRIIVLNEQDLIGVFHVLNFNEDTLAYYRLNGEGDVTGPKILEHGYIRHFTAPSSGHHFYDPFGGRGLQAVSSDNRIYTAWTEEMLIKVYNSDGTYERAFYHPFQNSRLGRTEARHFYGEGNERFERALQDAGVPDTWRAFEHMIMDDEDNLWLSAITDNREIYEWRVMDKFGELQAVFEWPRTREIFQVSGGYVYAVETEAETGLEQVVRYRLEWGEPGQSNVNSH